MSQMRPLADGSGYSECHATDENVNKRRCNHKLEGGSMEVRKEPGSGTKFIDIKDAVSDDSVSIKATDEKIHNYISTLSNSLSKEQRDAIIKELREL